MYTDVSEYLDWILDKTGLDASIIDLIYNKTQPGQNNHPNNQGNMFANI